MSGLLAVDTAAMARHAAGVRALAGRATVASDAARQVAFKPGMYGAIGAALVHPFLAPLELAGVAATRACVDSLEHTASAVTSVAETFDLVDDAVAGALRALAGGLR